MFNEQIEQMLNTIFSLEWTYTKWPNETNDMQHAAGEFFFCMLVKRSSFHTFKRTLTITIKNDKTNGTVYSMRSRNAAYMYACVARSSFHSFKLALIITNRTIYSMRSEIFFCMLVLHVLCFTLPNEHSKSWYDKTNRTIYKTIRFADVAYFSQTNKTMKYSGRFVCFYSWL